MKPRLSSPPLSMIATDLQEGDHLTDGLLVIHNPLLPTAKAATPFKNGSLIIGPPPSYGPPCHTIRALGERDSDPGRSRNWKSALDPSPGLHMSAFQSTPRRDPLKRLFGNRSKDAMMSTTTSYTKSITCLPIFMKGARTRSSSALTPSLLSYYGGMIPGQFKIS